jgi:phospholipid/cholesterol/gamma-HCH transport system permease protein
MRTLADKIKGQLQALGDFITFAWRCTYAGLRHPLRPIELVEFIDTLGVQSIAVTLFAGFFAGLSITLFLEGELDSYGAKMTLGRVIGTTAIRELGPLVVALMLTGRVGAAIAAELGSMKVGNQVDAIIALGQDPERKLAAPRIWALALLSPLLSVLTILATLVGGWVVSTSGAGMYWYQAQMSMYFRHISSGLLKPIIFGWLIGTIACYYGLKVEGGVRGVGEAVSKSVVLSIVLIFVGNALMGFLLLLWTGW